MSIIISIIAAFIVTFILLPIIIKVSRSVDLLDAPDRRKIHRVSTPRLGVLGYSWALWSLFSWPFLWLNWQLSSFSYLD